MIESPKLKTTERYYFLDVIRLILALIVCYEHTKIASQEASTIAAYIAVDIFFILSGYVLCQQIQNISYRDFVISRIARMFPLYWVSMLILYFLWNNVHPFDPNYFYNTITEFFLLHSVGFTDQPGLNGVSWSLSIEFWLNVIFLYFIVRHKPKNKNLFFSTVFIFIIFCIITTLRVAGSFDANIQPFSFFTNIGIIRGIAELLIGYLLYNLVNSNFIHCLNRDRRLNSIYEIILVFILFFSMSKNGSVGFGILSLLTFSLIIIRNKIGTGILSKASSLPIIRSLGHMSYAIYLLHIPCREFFVKYFPDFYQGIESKALFVSLVTFFISIPTFYLYELKAKKITKNYLIKFLASKV